MRGHRMNFVSTGRVLACLTMLLTLAHPLLGGGGPVPVPAPAILPVPGGAVRSGDDGVGGVEFVPGRRGSAPLPAAPALALVVAPNGRPTLRLRGAAPGATVRLVLAFADPADPGAPAPARMITRVADTSGALDVPLDPGPPIAPGRIVVAAAWVSMPEGWRPAGGPSVRPATHRPR